MPRPMRLPIGRRAWKPAFPGNSHGQGCPWHLAGACSCACRGGALFWSADLQSADGSGDRSPPPPRSERGGVPLQNAEAMHSRFVAARLPAPTGAGPAAHRTPGRNAEAFRYKMRRRCIRLFVAARLPAPKGVGPATHRPPGRNAEAFRYKMRRRCIRLFVAARLPAPTGAGPAAHHTPGRNAEAFRYKMRRRCIRLFLAARLPAPKGVGPAAHRTPGRNAEAFRYKMRGGDARSTGFPWSILEARASPPPARAGRDPMRGSAFTRRGGAGGRPPEGGTPRKNARRDPVGVVEVTTGLSKSRRGMNEPPGRRIVTARPQPFRAIGRTVVDSPPIGGSAGPWRGNDAA